MSKSNSTMLTVGSHSHTFCSAYGIIVCSNPTIVFSARSIANRLFSQRCSPYPLLLHGPMEVFESKLEELIDLRDGYFERFPNGTETERVKTVREKALLLLEVRRRCFLSDLGFPMCRNTERCTTWSSSP